MKKLVMLVEGEGDRDAIPCLVKRLITDQKAWESVVLDKEPPLIVGEIPGLVKNECAEWRRYLKLAVKTRRNAAGLLVVLDGDAQKILGQPFCARDVAFLLSEAARDVGAGSVFSLAVVIACLEYESWLIAGVESLAGKKSNQGFGGVRAGTPRYEGNVEQSPRAAKQWMSRVMESAYKPTIHQELLTSMIDLDVVRTKNVRSFQRMESAVSQIIAAFRSSAHVVTPRGVAPE